MASPIYIWKSPRTGASLEARFAGGGFADSVEITMKGGHGSLTLHLDPDSCDEIADILTSIAQAARARPKKVA